MEKRITLSEKTIPKLPIGRHRDFGGPQRGLYLQISDNGKSWLLRYDVECAPRVTNPDPKSGKAPRTTKRRERWLGLGSLETFSLKQARERARAIRQLLADGIDPLDRKKEEKAARDVAAAKAVTFEKSARLYHEEKSTTWKNPKHRAQFISSLELYAFPIIGPLPVESIDQELVLKVLEQKHADYPDQRLWDAIPETAARLRHRIEKILGWDIVRNKRNKLNPALWKGHLEHVLTARKKGKHFAALSYKDIGDFFVKLRQFQSATKITKAAIPTSIVALALEFTILTAVRTEQTVGAPWSEFHLDAVPVTTVDEETGFESTVLGPVWIVPGDRMKMGERHRIPLSDRAVEILKEMKNNRNPAPDSLVFDGLTDIIMWKLLTQKMKYAVTVHGFRSTFRSWAGDTTNHPREAAEKAIAHKVKDKSEAAYWREDMFDKRVPLMRDWARFCDLPKLDASISVLSEQRRKVGA